MSTRNAKAWRRSYSRDSTRSNPAVEQRSVTMSSTAPNREADGGKEGNLVFVYVRLLFQHRNVSLLTNEKGVSREEWKTLLKATIVCLCSFVALLFVFRTSTTHPFRNAPLLQKYS